MFASFDGVYNTLVFAILGIIIPRIANSYNDVGGYASLEFFDTLWKMTAVMSAIFTIIAVISIAPKDRSEFFGTGKPVKVGLEGLLGYPEEQPCHPDAGPVRIYR